MKVCTKCNQNKDLNDFYSDKRHTDGKMSRCKSCHKATCVQWRKTNPEKNLIIMRRNYSRLRWRFDRAKRHSAKMSRTPKWLTKEQLKEIRNFYYSCPEGYEVDHIVPLRGKNVNGLHVIWNLQYLPKEENRRKSNK